MLPLEGIKVLDFSVFVPTQTGVGLLGDMGADVLRIEPLTPRMPSAPEVSPVFKDADPREVEAAHAVALRNKKSIRLNLISPEGKEVFYKLVKDADVIVVAFRPSGAKRMGIDYETIKQRNPRIIYCTLSGFGFSGPYQELPGFGLVSEAVGGLTALTGTKQGQHVMPGLPIADFCGATHIPLGVMLALWAREKTGKGQFVDVAQVDCLLYWMGAYHAPRYFSRGVLPKRGVRPTQLYKTKDRKWLFLGVYAGGLAPFWEKFCIAAGVPELSPYVDDIAGEATEKGEVVKKRLRRLFLTRTRDEWLKLLKEADTPSAPVYTLDEAFSDPHVLAREMLVEVAHPHLGKVKMAGIPIKLSDTPGKIRSLGVVAGTHTDEVMRSLGYSVSKIKNLRSQGVVG